MDEDHLGNFIRYLRQHLGMTQEELAHSLGITVGTVNRWENRRFRPSKLARATILAFARQHGVSTTPPYAPPKPGDDDPA